MRDSEKQGEIWKDSEKQGETVRDHRQEEPVGNEDSRGETGKDKERHNNNHSSNKTS